MSRYMGAMIGTPVTIAVLPLSSGAAQGQDGQEGVSPSTASLEDSYGGGTSVRAGVIGHLGPCILWAASVRGNGKREHGFPCNPPSANRKIGKLVNYRSSALGKKDPRRPNPKKSISFMKDKVPPALTPRQRLEAWFALSNQPKSSSANLATPPSTKSPSPSWTPSFAGWKSNRQTSKPKNTCESPQRLSISWAVNSGSFPRTTNNERVPILRLDPQRRR